MLDHFYILVIEMCPRQPIPPLSLPQEFEDGEFIPILSMPAEFEDDEFVPRHCAIAQPHYSVIDLSPRGAIICQDCQRRRNVIWDFAQFLVNIHNNEDALSECDEFPKCFYCDNDIYIFITPTECRMCCNQRNDTPSVQQIFTTES
ncbi:hypothetical protein QE152_g29966 [Popillia japonica]|uniref:Uncharacterized protein n=1 Tax=Popillia japonica TaxID=7064 RepID=A0AAW1JGC8_POPJA